MLEYGYWIQSNRLHWLETERPIIYNVFKPDGGKYMTVFSETQVEELIKEGYKIEEGDLDEVISQLRSRVKSLENQRKSKDL